MPAVSVRAALDLSGPSDFQSFVTEDTEPRAEVTEQLSWETFILPRCVTSVSPSVSSVTLPIAGGIVLALA
jgi:hypothetical protein